MNRDPAPTDPRGRRVPYATTLPMEIDEETVSANLDGGVLTLRVRKSLQSDRVGSPSAADRPPRRLPGSDTRTALPSACGPVPVQPHRRERRELPHAVQHGLMTGSPSSFRRAGRLQSALLDVLPSRVTGLFRRGRAGGLRTGKTVLAAMLAFGAAD